MYTGDFMEQLKLKCVPEASIVNISSRFRKSNYYLKALIYSKNTATARDLTYWFCVF